ncbi:helix-turn-helix domain-containing protein (plasmid) [Rhodococcus qingshengii]|uniref:PucR family transcriptional regulator n=1 Tax=Rhodococcus qingshengii TaxID=334542 RepID=UPI002112ECA0|nr:PucR family transcriptional regulator [Rhodococcus qingshengii]UUE28677.1 helix-turn-helix domain-containing protein [Rhodococcus qingshengii]
MSDDRTLLPVAVDPTRKSEISTLRELLSALDRSVVELVDAPVGDDIAVDSVALVDSTDLSADMELQSPLPNLMLHVGIGKAEAIRWFEHLAHLPPASRPRAVMSKTATESRALQVAARRAGVALVAVHPRARWDHLLPLLQRMLDHSRRRQARLGDPDLLATDTDLFGLAQIVAQNSGGMVSIEDAQSHVLAYSASDEAADELRTLSILGREGPRDYLRALQKWGVFSRLRDTDDVVDVPAHPKLGTKRRLVVSIRESFEGSSTPRVLGTIWVQQGDSPLAPDAADVLRGASAIAARIISRILDAPSAEALLIQRLFGMRGSGVDVPSVAGALHLPVSGPSAVVGFALTVSDTTAPIVEFTELGRTLRLHASSFSRDSVSTIIGERAYVLLPRHKSAKTVTAWVGQLVDQFEMKRSIVLRAAIAAPVTELGQVSEARIEVDRVLDRTAETFPRGRVTTLADSRTVVLLGEIFDLVEGHPELHDPRLDALFEYDSEHASNLCESVESYFAHLGDVRGAATALQVHPNTLRYRLRRVEEIVGVDLQDSADRLLVELQLRLRRATSARVLITDKVPSNQVAHRKKMSATEHRGNK